ncbi:PepSY domain-containing protein [Sporosarcina limicola]|nr:PepSY domain-containing protein [Sporosarcina limicola]
MKRPWFIPMLLTLIILAVGGLFIGSLLTKEKVLADVEIRSLLEGMYNGSVADLTMENGVYGAEIVRNDAVYVVEIDAVTGSVLSLVQTGGAGKASTQVLSEEEIRGMIAEKNTGEVEHISLDESDGEPVYEVKLSKNQQLTTVKMDAKTGLVLSEKIDETTIENAVITKKQAIKIAHKKLKGEVEYVTFKKTDDGGYYLIEIDGDHDEAVFQIHAISGKVLSIIWDD